MVGADVARVEDARRRGQRVDGGVDAHRGDLTVELGRGVEVRERRGRGRVGVVVCGHVDRLQRRDRVTTSRGDALLEDAHLVGQRRLVAHGGGHAAQQRGDLGTGLREAEDVVDEQQHVLVLDVAEVLGHRQGRQGDAKTRSRRLVHLAEDEGGLSEDAGLLHLGDEVVALTRALADAGEHRHTAVVAGDAGDHLLDQHGLADTGTTEQADLAAEHVGRQQVDDLDAGLEHLGLGLELVERGGLAVDATTLLDLPHLTLLEVHDVAGGVEHLAERLVADGDRDGPAGVGDRRAADDAVGRAQADRADQAVTDVERDLEGQRLVDTVDRGVDLERVVHLRDRVARELDVEHRADDASDPAVARLSRRRSSWLRSLGGRHLSHSLPAVASASALAPPTISLISWVIPACRAWLAVRVYFSMRSSALSVADFIAF